MTPTEIERQAKAELEAEAFRAAVDKMKADILSRRTVPLWHLLFPFTITIKRRK
jgi:hypothetical protein